MNGRIGNWAAVGERWLITKACLNCRGTGNKKTSAVQDCPKCKKLGYINDPNDDFSLCPKCKGMRHVTIEANKPCPKCKGKGLVAVIMQRFERQIPCKSCKGTGQIKASRPSHITDCRPCEGHGYLPRVAYSISKWKKRNSRPTAKDIPVSEPDEDGCVYFKSGLRAKVIPCQVCGDEEDLFVAPGKSIERIDPKANKPSCPNCEGKRKLIEVSAPCKECRGKGIVHVYTETACVDCAGRGNVLIETEMEV